MNKTIHLTFPHSKLSDYERLVKKFNRKAKKFGFSPVNMTVKDTSYIPCSVYMRNEDGKQILVKKIDLKHVTVEVTGQFPKFEGWSLVARLDHTPSGENIVNMFPSFYGQSIPQEFRTRQHCDHCNTNRNRKATILIVDDNRTYKQIGTNCIADYLRSGDVEEYLIAEELTSLTYSPVSEISTDEYRGESGGFSEYGIETVKFLAECIALVEKYGFQPTKVDNEYKSSLRSTKTQAEINFFSLKLHTIYTPEDMKRAETILEWLRGIDPKNEYMSNLKVLADLSYVSYKHLGLIASMTITYQRHLNSQREAKLSNFVGTVGERIDIEVRLVFKKEFETAYGWTLMNLMEDKDGNQFVWWTQKEDLPSEGFFKLRGRIKAHNIYNEKKQTVITRAKLLG